MFGHVCNPDAQVAASLVNVELAKFEHGTHTRRSRIEIREKYEILQKPVKVSVVKHQLLYVIDGVGLCLYCLVLFHKGKQLVFSVLLQNLLHSFDTETFHLTACLGTDPGSISIELAENGIPFFLIDSLLVFRGEVQCQCEELVECRLPGRVDSTERKNSVLSRLCYRTGSDRVNVSYSHIDRFCHGLVERQKSASCEKVRYLVFYGIAGLVCRCGIVTERQNLCIGLVLPLGVLGASIVEFLD